MRKLCLRCHEPMTEARHLGVLFDICPRCDEIWLHRAEPDEIASCIREPTITEPAYTVVYETSLRRSWDEALNERHVDDHRQQDEECSHEKNASPF